MAKILIADEDGNVHAEITQTADLRGDEMLTVTCRTCDGMDVGDRPYAPIADHIAVAEIHVDIRHGEG